MKFKWIGQASTLACILEVSALKPGNINPLHDFHDTTFEDFVRGSLALQPIVEEAAERCFWLIEEGRDLSELGLGALVRKAVRAVKSSHDGGNTHMGIIMLHLPLAAAAGLSLAEAARLEARKLRSVVRAVVNATTVGDAMNFYSAVRELRPGGLRRISSELDVMNPQYREVLLRRRLNLARVMELSENNIVAQEVARGMPIVFEEGLKELEHALARGRKLREAILYAYLRLLARHPDSLILNKLSEEVALKVLKGASELIHDAFSKEWWERLQAFDAELRTQRNELNPGATADLIAAATFVHLLCRS